MKALFFLLIADATLGKEIHALGDDGGVSSWDDEELHSWGDDGEVLAESFFHNQKPNIVFFLADDMGYGDLPIYGNPSIRTPNLDRIAALGLKFYQMYSGSSVCSPSRAALMTGRHPRRSGVYPPADHPEYNTFFPFAAGGVPESEVMLPELLKPAGYRCGIVGKWHLGNHNQSLPTQNPGFDSFWGVPYSHDIGVVKNLFLGANNSCPSCAFWNMQLGGLGIPLYRNATIIQQPMDASTFNKQFEVETLRFIKDSARGRKPFFLLVSHVMPHVPLVVSKEFQDTQLRGLYGDAIAEMDSLIGKIMKQLKGSGIHRKTMFIFTSDNGPWLSQGIFGGSSGPFRSGKGTGWEGGFRMPCVVYHPGKILPGSTQAIASHLDWFPTFADLAGVGLPIGKTLDGKSLVPLWKWKLFPPSPPAYRNEYAVRDSVAFYINDVLVAARHKSYKAHFVTIDSEGSPPVIQNPPLLFNVDVDVGEKFPLDVTLPENAQALQGIQAFVAALAQTYVVEPPLPQVLGVFTSTVPCCAPPACQC